MKGTERAPHAILPPPALHSGASSNQYPANAGATRASFIGVCQVLVQSPWAVGPGLRGRGDSPRGRRTGEFWHECPEKRLLGLGVGSVQGVVCTSQPKTLLAGPALGFSKTVSVPVRVRLNTDGAALPTCSAGRMGGVLRGLALRPEGSLLL